MKLIAGIALATMVCGAAHNGLAAGPFIATAQESIVPAGVKVELLWNEGEFTEGPVLAVDGGILFSDIGDRIYKFHPRSRAVSVFRDPSGRSNGLAMDRQGRLIAAEGANAGGRRQISITEQSGVVRTLANSFEGKRFNSPNDLAVDAHGRVYFTDPRYVGDEPRELDFEAVFLVAQDGNVKVATRDLQKPNGVAVSADGKIVYVADNNGAPTGNHHLLAFDVAADGTLAGKKILFDFGPNRRGIDGMTLDAAGNIYATGGTKDEAGVYVFSPAGKNLAFVPLPGDPTNCEFGGENEPTTLYITAAGPGPVIAKTGRPLYGLYRIRLALPGRSDER